MAHAKPRRRKEDLEPHKILTPLLLQGRRRGWGMRWGNTRSLCFANSIGYEKTRSWLGFPVRIVLSEAVLVLREAVLVLEPTSINIATMNDRSRLIEVGVFRVRVPFALSTSTSTKTSFFTLVMSIPQQAASSVVQCSSHPHPPRFLLPPKRAKPLVTIIIFIVKTFLRRDLRHESELFVGHRK